MSVKLTIEDILYSYKHGCGGSQSLNKLLVVKDDDFYNLFQDFLKHKDEFLQCNWIYFEKNQDGTAKIYEMDRNSEYAPEFFKNEDDAYLAMFKRIVNSYNWVVNWTIKRPTPEDAKKFPELYHMKREPWGD